MVGLVLVSHSRSLAEALHLLVSQVASENLPIAIAAGIGDGRAEFGTDAVEISEAIMQVMSDEGVLVLMDLGSAVLSAQLAVELLPPEISAKVRFCAAPLIEGAIAAGVQMSLGSDLDMVCTEARQALLPKQEQIAPVLPQESPVALPTSAQGVSRTARLVNQYGLHARPAARFVKAAASFESTIQVENLTNGKGPVAARSLNAVATLGAVGGHEVRITANGPDAQAALQALCALIETGFGEKEGEAAPAPELPVREAIGEGENRAVPVSEGIALAPLYCYQPPRPTIPAGATENAEADWLALQKAIQSTREAIQVRGRQMRQMLTADEAAIFDAHDLILQDPELVEAARRNILEGKMNAAAAWNTAFMAVADEFRLLDDSYLRMRAADVEDVGTQVLFALAGKPAMGKIGLPQPVILYAQDLTPTETSQLDMGQVLGILTAVGGPTSHSAILARALGIPSVAGVGGLVDRQAAGKLVGLNGFTGEIWVDPPEMIQAALKQQRGEWLAKREALLKRSQEPAATQDGHRIEVFANIGSLADAQAAVKNGAEGVGLLRTEFLFLTRQEPPSEEEQALLLGQIFETLGENPVTVRTLDVGGDKNLPYIQLPVEANPFLGVRALRLSLNQPGLFLPQLRAILRAAAGHFCRIMFPMVADVSEVRQARIWLEKAHSQLTAENLPHAWPIETGIMVEIPSAALLSPGLAHEVDFFSIGTNDLTQYTLAAERGNPQLANLADGLHPAVLRLIGLVAEAAHAAGKWVGICGELGGDPVAAPVLVGLGIDELSLNPAGIPRVKALLRGLTIADAQDIAHQALQLQTSAEVRALAEEFIKAKAL